MKYILLYFIFLPLEHLSGYSQRADKQLADSLHALLPNVTDDSAKVKLYEEIMRDMHRDMCALVKKD